MAIYQIQLCTTRDEILNNSWLICVDCNVQWGLGGKWGVAGELTCEAEFNIVLLMCTPGQGRFGHSSMFSGQAPCPLCQMTSAGQQCGSEPQLGEGCWGKEGKR